MYWDHMNGWGWTMMLAWSLLGIGFLAVLGWAAAHWARREPPRQSPPQTKTARGLLDERLANGDIDVDEYQRRREALEQATQAVV